MLKLNAKKFCFIVTETKGSEKKMVDITRDKPIKVAVRVVVPVRDHPKVMFSLYKTLNINIQNNMDNK